MKHKFTMDGEEVLDVVQRPDGIVFITKAHVYELRREVKWVRKSNQ